MGKAQSKRSVDITTEGKKSPDEEIAGRLEKIEDNDQKQSNGDATPEKNDSVVEKKEGDVTENDKDLSTEKNDVAGTAENQNVDQSAIAAESPKDETVQKGETLENTVSEEISPLADESTKKSKKEKVKKKWSFRNISFGKKDKQKPVKPEETTEEVAVITTVQNGEAEVSTLEEVKVLDKNEEVATGEGDVETKKGKDRENGEASENELNAENASTLVEKELTGDVAKDSVENETTESNAKIDSAIGVEKNSATAVSGVENKTENQTIQDVPIINGGGGGDDKNGGANVENTADDVLTDLKRETDVPVAVEKSKAAHNAIADDGSVKEGQPHQNGLNGDELGADTKKSELGNEVNTKTVTTDDDDDRLSADLVCIQSDKSDLPNNLIDNEKIDNVVVLLNIDANFGEGKGIINDNNRVDGISNAQPPPLPISSPPSQMSVFAFNEEVVEIGQISASKENENEEAVIIANDNIETDISNGIASNENIAEDVEPSHVEQTNAVKNDEGEEKKDININIVEAIVKEITEKASDSIEMMLNESKETETAIAIANINVIGDQPENKTNHCDIKANKSGDQIDNNKSNDNDIITQTEFGNPEDCITTENIMIKTFEKCLININESSDDDNVRTVRDQCGNSVQQSIENETNVVTSNEDDYNNDNNPYELSKEIVNAKDLKDVAAVEIKSQDLSVTCE